jgi:hypothetical protein
MLKQKTLSTLQTLLSSNGFILEKATNKYDILDLIGLLKPYATNHSLIRLGAQGDGGYLVPDDLDGISACFSPGVGAFSTFEDACAQRGMQVYLADYSVDAPLIANDRFHFTKKFIGPITHGNYVNLEDWVNTNRQENVSDLLLQMDIEGYEYLTLLSISDNLLKQFRIITIEFHYLGKLWNKEFYTTAFAAINKILQSHTCVHIHPNNYCGIENIQGIEIPRAAEFTFLRNDRISEKKPQTTFPHKLDFDNIKDKAIVLPKCWYRTDI